MQTCKLTYFWLLLIYLAVLAVLLGLLVIFSYSFFLQKRSRFSLGTRN